MRTFRRFRQVGSVGALAISALLIMGTVGATPAAADTSPSSPIDAESVNAMAKIKMATDVPGWDAGVIAPAGEQKLELDAKQAATQLLLNKTSGQSIETAALPAKAALPQNYQAQDYNNYCGPATMAMALNHMGVDWSQAKIAKKIKLKPNKGGTGWADFINTANSAKTGVVWDNQVLAYSPTDEEKKEYRTRLLASINGQTGSGQKYPLIGDAWEVSGGPHLPGHPANQTIFHWFHIRGYDENGAKTWIQDPATSVWAGVPAHSLNSSDNLVTIMGGRGYLY